MDPITNKLVACTEVERRQPYLDKITDEAVELRKMVKCCLDDDPGERPLIEEVSAVIDTLKESPSMVEGLQSEKYHIKWTTCSDLPYKLHNASVAVSADGSTVYVTGDAYNLHNRSCQCNVYCYDTKADCWTVLPQPGHRFGILYMLDDKLTIFGGIDPVEARAINKVTTYISSTRCWYSFYPDMLHARFKPGVVTYRNYVIVMGGSVSEKELLDSIEIMNYHNDLRWKEASIRLPVPMWVVRSTISDNSITIIGFGAIKGNASDFFQIAAEEIILSLTQPFFTTGTFLQWKHVTRATYFDTTTIPGSYPPVIIGGSDVNNFTTSDIMLYDITKDMWRKVDMLTSARRDVGIGLLSKKSIIVIGGSRKGGDIEIAEESALTKVEIGNIVHKPAIQLN